MKKKFIRTDSTRYSKLGRNRRKLQKWRKARGRDNKIREKRAGHPSAPSVGHKKPRKNAGKLKGFSPVRVNNLRDLKKVGEKNIIIIGKVGARKKLEIIKKISERNLRVANLAGDKK